MAPVDRAALMNAIWTYYPEYAILFNQAELCGKHDMLGNLLMALGEEDIALHGSVNNTITLSKHVGTEYLEF